MTIRFKCPHCQKTLGVKDHLAGKRAACPNPECKKVLRIPSPTPPTAASPTPAVDIEALAAGALADEPAPPPEPTEPAEMITFTCNWCAEEVQVTADLAGKQTPCPNPECKRIVKVPVPVKEKKKDWREIDLRKGPSAALLNQPEKLDGVMSSRDDKAKVSTKALVEAGVVKLPPKPGLNTRQKVNRVMTGICTVIVVVTLVLVLSRLKNEKGAEGTAKKLWDPDELKSANFKSSVLLAELHRGAGLILANTNLKKTLLELQTARGCIPREVDAKTPSIDRDLWLGQLALAQVELGGSEDEAQSKTKFRWKEEVNTELGQTLDMIKAPDARAWALRALATRLLEKKQPELAIGLAAKLANASAGQGRRPVASQMIALAVATDSKKLLDGLPKAPEVNGKDDFTDVVARVGHAEGLARKGEVQQAREIALVKGPDNDKLEACAGVAAVILMTAKEKAAEQAKPFLDEGLNAAKSALAAAAQKKAYPPSPWVLLQLVHLAARTKGVEVEPYQKLIEPALPPEFQTRAKLEVFLGRCAVVTDDAVQVPRPDELGKDETAIGLALEAVARQNAVTGYDSGLEDLTKDGAAEARYRLLVRLGTALAGR